MELAKPGDVALTRIGTPQYKAPEMMEKGTYDSMVDVWALGVVLYEMFHLQRMFPDPYRVLEHIRENKQRPFDLDCPDSIEKLVKQCTQRDPNNRPDIRTLFEQVDEIKCELDAAKEARGIQSMRVTDTIKPQRKCRNQSNWIITAKLNLSMLMTKHVQLIKMAG